MRIVVLLLALLAGTKIYVQDTLFRSGAEEALVAAYRDRAVSACQRQPTDVDGRAVRGVTWSAPDAIRMTTGTGTADVYFWQVDQAAWNARYRNPILVLMSPSATPDLRCEYDILYAQATIVRS